MQFRFACQTHNVGYTYDGASLAAFALLTAAAVVDSPVSSEQAAAVTDVPVGLTQFDRRVCQLLLAVRVCACQQAATGQMSLRYC